MGGKGLAPIPPSGTRLLTGDVTGEGPCRDANRQPCRCARARGADPGAFPNQRDLYAPTSRIRPDERFLTLAQARGGWIRPRGARYSSQCLSLRADGYPQAEGIVEHVCRPPARQHDGTQRGRGHRALHGRGPVGGGRDGTCLRGRRCAGRARGAQGGQAGARPGQIFRRRFDREADIAVRVKHGTWSRCSTRVSTTASPTSPRASSAVAHSRRSSSATAVWMSSTR